MGDWQEHSEDTETQAPQRLAGDLRGLYRTEVPIPPEIDAAIASTARQHFAGRRRARMVLRLVKVSAAAAAIALVILVSQPSTHQKTPLATRHAGFGPQLSPADIDRSGRVDILDAFALARRIERGDGLGSEWDANGDGVVDRTDVDAVAHVAVRLTKG
ncbi:MAG: hypothetical protein GY842_25170 [bacterium]|nr:hypothetical protein [bacterium]